MIRFLSTSRESFSIPLRTAFRFGVVELRELKHLMLLAAFEIDDHKIEGIAGENLAPKWFSKNPTTTLEQDVRELEQSIAATIELAKKLPAAKTPFDFWLNLYRAAAEQRPAEPKLVRQLGVSMIERAMIDAFCRRVGRPFHAALNENALGLRVSAVHPAIADSMFGEVFPIQPAESLIIRHTVGLSDDLEALPPILANTGTRRLKIKLGGDPNGDARRLADIIAAVPIVERVTLDGNENYRTLGAMRDFLSRLRESKQLERARQLLA
jgi:L-alanine-DL-glutamate epimerase-like enolase superfamily enzyme